MKDILNISDHDMLLNDHRKTTSAKSGPQPSTYVRDGVSLLPLITVLAQRSQQQRQEQEQPSMLRQLDDSVGESEDDGKHRINNHNKDVVQQNGTSGNFSCARPLADVRLSRDVKTHVAQARAEDNALLKYLGGLVKISSDSGRIGTGNVDNMDNNGRRLAKPVDHTLLGAAFDASIVSSRGKPLFFEWMQGASLTDQQGRYKVSRE